MKKKNETNKGIKPIEWDYIYKHNGINIRILEENGLIEIEDTIANNSCQTGIGTIAKLLFIVPKELIGKAMQKAAIQAKKQRVSRV